MNSVFSRMSLLWKILLSTSVALTTLFAVTLAIVQRHVVRTTYRTLQEEVNRSFQVYDSLWKAQAEKLAAIGLVLSRMSDVRSAFSTRDQATIRDTAGELWSTVSDQKALFLVSDPEGNVIASLGGAPGSFLKENLPVVSASAPRFPQQTSGFMLKEGRLYQIVITPVYVDSVRGETLLNVLVAGYLVDPAVAWWFKEATGGSEFVFLSNRGVIASTLPEGVPAHQQDYASVSRPLVSVEGSPIGELRNDPEWRPRLQEAVDETCAVAAGEGVSLTAAAQWEIIDAMPPDLTSSTARDVAVGRPSELDAITGAAVRAGRRLGVPMPTLERLFAEAEDACRAQSH